MPSSSVTVLKAYCLCLPDTLVTVTTGRPTFHPQWVDTCIDTLDLPEYLQPLMEGAADDITLHQREVLATTIFEY